VSRLVPGRGLLSQEDFLVKRYEWNLHMLVQELSGPTGRLVKILMQNEEIRVSLFSLFFDVVRLTVPEQIRAQRIDIPLH